MHHAAGMRLVERVGNLDGNLQRLGERDRPTLESVSKSLAKQVLHHDVVDAVLRADVVQGAYVRMIQRRDSFSLALQSLSQFGVGRKMRGENLDSHIATKPSIPCAIDFAHTARA